jgi:hypothetical protein
VIVFVIYHLLKVIIFVGCFLGLICWWGAGFYGDSFCDFFCFIEII